MPCFGKARFVLASVCPLGILVLGIGEAISSAIFRCGQECGFTAQKRCRAKCRLSISFGESVSSLRDLDCYTIP